MHRSIIIIQVEAFVPVRIEGSLGDGRGPGLLAIDGGHGEGIGKA